MVSERLDPESAFQLKTQMRLACKKAFAEEDCSKRVARNILSKAAPIPMDYAVGDLVSFKRKQGAKTQEQLWSTPTRLIGFDGEQVVFAIDDAGVVGLPKLPRKIRRISGSMVHKSSRNILREKDK